MPRPVLILIVVAVLLVAGAVALSMMGGAVPQSQVETPVTNASAS